ncbi:MAG: DUF3343 domain-containing protein [Lachnospiraceae bacterium]|jgi:hypothetical protein|nr:DUF3343 domain-containing protein [Lachnospiraceae bacterium]
MREKKKCTVISFDTTASAMAVERYCKAKGLPGRLIPIPREITAECGLAWRVPGESGAEVLAGLDAGGLEHGAVYELML